MSLIQKAAAFVGVGLACTISARVSAQSVNLAPNYRPHQQTDSERLQETRTPPPAAKSYPNLSSGDSGGPRLNVNRDVSLGGSISTGGAEGNVRFPIPGQR